MNPKLAEIALAFLERVDLKGAEVEAFMAVKSALRHAMVEEETKRPVSPDTDDIGQ